MTSKTNGISRGFTLAAGVPLIFPASHSRKSFFVVNPTLDDLGIAFGENPVAEDFIPIPIEGHIDLNPMSQQKITLSSAIGGVVVIMSDDLSEEGNAKPSFIEHPMSQKLGHVIEAFTLSVKVVDPTNTFTWEINEHENVDNEDVWTVLPGETASTMSVGRIFTPSTSYRCLAYNAAGNRTISSVADITAYGIDATIGTDTTIVENTADLLVLGCDIHTTTEGGHRGQWLLDGVEFGLPISLASVGLSLLIIEDPTTYRLPNGKRKDLSGDWSMKVLMRPQDTQLTTSVVAVVVTQEVRSVVVTSPQPTTLNFGDGVVAKVGDVIDFTATTNVGPVGGSYTLTVDDGVEQGMPWLFGVHLLAPQQDVSAVASGRDVTVTPFDDGTVTSWVFDTATITPVNEY